MCAVSFQSQPQAQLQSNNTNSGLIAGSILGGTQLINLLVNKKNTDTYERVLKEASKDMPEEKEFFENLTKSLKKHSKSSLILGTIITAGISIGCGALYDRIRNKKAEAAKKAVNEKDIDTALAEGHSIAFNKTGSPYYKSNQGGKIGALLGLGVGIFDFCRVTLSKNFKENIEIAEKQLKEINISTKNLKGSAYLGLAATIPIAALGGWIMGKISDFYSNKSAEKASYRKAQNVA